jgi:hypothetical protein
LPRKQKSNECADLLNEYDKVKQAIEEVSTELKGVGANFTRGPEIEIQAKKDIENLMHELSRF